MFHIPIFKVVYSTTFTVFLVALLGLLLITPADAIFQSYVNNQLFNVVIIGAAYLLTALVAAFIYATRIYATRTHLTALPRSARVPNDVAGTAIRRIVAAGQARAAAIAYAAHPRDLAAERDEDGHPLPVPTILYTPAELSARDLPKPMPAFGPIAHPGWTSPSTPDLPGMQFAPVIHELPHLLEAKAVSLAPPDPLATAALLPTGADDGSAAPPPPDPFAVAVLQRPAAMDARSYIAHLSSLGAIEDANVAAEFVTRYEQARFSGRSLTEAHFRRLMNCFAALLRSLAPPDPELLHDLARSSSTSTSTSSAPRSPMPRSEPGSSLHSTPSTSSLRKWNTTTSTSQPTARPAMSASAAGLLQRLVTGSDVELASAPSNAPLQRGAGADTPTPHATPFFTPYRSYVSSNDSSTTGSGSGDSYDADRDSGDSDSDANGNANGEGDGTTPSRHRRHRPRQQRHRNGNGNGTGTGTGTGSSRQSRPGAPLRSHSAALRQVGLGLQRLERDGRRSSADDQDPGWVSFDSEGLGRGTENHAAVGEASTEGEQDAQSEAGSVIRRYVTADYPRSHEDRDLRMADSPSEAGSVVVRPEDRPAEGSLPIPLVAQDARDELAEEGHNDLQTGGIRRTSVRL